MALAALFAQMALGPNDSKDDSQPTEETIAATRTNSTLQFASVDSFSDKVLDVLPKAKRKALTTAKITNGYEYQREKCSGPAHFRLVKTGLGREFDVVLGDPCTCVVAPHPNSTNRHTGGLRSGAGACDEGTALLLVYFVLVRVLSVESSDVALMDVPHLSSRTVARLLDHAQLAKRRALRHDHAKQRLAYEQDVAFEPGEAAAGGGSGGGGEGSTSMDFERTLGDAEIVGPGTMRVHPRQRLFGGLPPVVLGAGNVNAASATKSNAMVAIDNVVQAEQLWRSTVTERKRRPREGELFGQSTAPHRLASASLGPQGHRHSLPQVHQSGCGGGGGDGYAAAEGTVDPYWRAAASMSGATVFPWRRELHMSERVAMLSKDDSSLHGEVPGAMEEAVLSPLRENAVSGGGGGGGSGRTAGRRGGGVDGGVASWKAGRGGGGVNGGAGQGSPSGRASSSPPMFGTTAQPGLNGAGIQSERVSRIPAFPFATAGGRVVVDSGTVLPPGMGVRHPALARAANFRSSVLEFLLLWGSSQVGSQRQKAFGELVDALRLKHSKFRAWVRAVYGKNKRRANFMRANPIRITVLVPDGRAVQVKVSSLATGVDLKAMLEAKLNGSASGSKGAKRDGKYRFVGRGVGQGGGGGEGGGTTELLFEGVPIDDRVSLHHTGVRPRSTLTLTRVPVQMMRGDDGLPVY